ncbi:MAG: 6-carboxytetrahydropterin synthase QueD [Verrucomicrobiota bacterium]|nr:6-carboxytetrahydropterin synthase QueD [Verrucomicrobiota bacterium]
MFEISVRSRFSAAHHLPGYPGKCASVHGHNWEVEVRVRGARLNRAGMLMDFCALKDAVAEALSRLDHRDLNAVALIRGIAPTSENIARALFGFLSTRLKSKNCRVTRVSARESPDTQATYFLGAGE